MVNFNWFILALWYSHEFSLFGSEADISHVIISGHLIVIVLNGVSLATERIGLESDIAWNEENEQE